MLPKHEICKSPLPITVVIVVVVVVVLEAEEVVLHSQNAQNSSTIA